MFQQRPKPTSAVHLSKQGGDVARTEHDNKKEEMSLLSEVVK